MALIYSQPTNHNTVFGCTAAEVGCTAAEVGWAAAEVGCAAVEVGCTAVIATGFGSAVDGTASYCHRVHSIG